MTARGLVAVMAVAAACLVAVSSAGADGLRLEGIFPPGDQQVVFPSVDTSSVHGFWGADVGDVNGDGIDDTGVVVGGQPSTAWISFSAALVPQAVSAGGPGWSGFRIVGDIRGIAGIGDTNGDGLSDIAVGTAVVFGRMDGATIDLSNLGDAGFSIVNGASGCGRGSQVLAGNNESFSPNHALAGVGDENGDGRPDLAFVSGTKAKVVFTPSSPAGASIDAANLGTGGFTLDTGSPQSFNWNICVADLGDLDGDGRDDLAVAWYDENSGATHVVGVKSPAPGTVVDLAHAADAGTGFEFVIPGKVFDDFVALGDQNGDGRSDFGVVAGYDFVIGYSPPLGTRRDTTTSSEWRLGGGIGVSTVTNVGDQDGDGRDDYASSNRVTMADTSPSGSPDDNVNSYSTGQIWMSGSAIIAGLRDRNGDGKPELVTVTPLPVPPGEWSMNVFLSAPTPVSEDVPTPVDAGDVVHFTGKFVTDSGSPISTLRGVARLLLTPSVNTYGMTNPVYLGALGHEAVATVDVPASSLTPGTTYRYRIELANDRGVVGLTPPRSFTFRPPTAHTNPLIRVPSPKQVHVLRGTRRGDRLVGTSGPDVIWGLGGNDRIRGLGGVDRLYGGTGNDVIDSRDRSADRVDCGPGRDRVRADRRDHVARNCERVTR